MALQLIDVGIGVCCALLLLTIWASNQVSVLLRYDHPITWTRLAQPGPSLIFGLPKMSRASGYLPAYILFGYYNDLGDPAVRRYGDMARFSLFGGVGLAIALVLSVLITKYL